MGSRKNGKLAVAVLFCLVAGATQAATGFRPGRWQLSMHSTTTMGGHTIPFHMTATRCLKKPPGGVPVNGLGGGSCRIKVLRTSGNTVYSELICQGGMRLHDTVTTTGKGFVSRYHGGFTQHGLQMSMSGATRGVWLGTCKGE